MILKIIIKKIGQKYYKINMNNLMMIQTIKIIIKIKKNK